MQLTDGENLYHTVLHAPIGICILDADTLVAEFVNDKFLEVAGKPYEAIFGQFYWDAFEEVRSYYEDALAEVVKTGEAYNADEVELMLIRHGREEKIFVNFIYGPVKNALDEVTKVAVWVLENTKQMHDRREVEIARAAFQQDLQEARELSEQQKRVYETIIDSTPDLVYVFDLNYRFTYVNSALLSMWGKTWENAIGRNLLENGYEPWHAEMHEREIDKIKATKQPIRGEVSFPHATLGKRVYDYILTPILNEQGEVEAVAGTTRDITERKQWEDALAQSSEELQAINEEMVAINEEQAASNEELAATNHELELVNAQLLEARQKVEEAEVALRLAINAANFGTWFIHSVTLEFTTDDRLKELFGYYPHETLSIEQALAQITEEYRPYVAKKLEDAIYHNGDYDVTYPVIGLHDNRLRWLRAIGNLKADPSGAFSAFTGVVMEITEQKQDEIRKDDFISMVSHELKTPLTSLTTIVQIADRKLKNNDDKFLASAMEKANKQVKRMSSMISGFLNISRLESGKILIEKRPFDIDQLLQEMIIETQLTTTQHIEFGGCGEVMVFGDQDKISSVISNLMSNAVKYSLNGKLIKVKCESTASEVIISVKDEGMGIKSEDMGKVFDRYFRVETNQTQHISGFGIGLYLSAEIVRRHDGKIWVESESGIGSTFYFSLPLLV